MSTGTGHCPSPTPTATISSRAIRRKHHPRATTATASSLPAAAAAISLLLALRSIPAAAAAANSRRAIGASPSSPPTAFLTAGRAHHFRRSARRPPIMNGGSPSAALAVAGACAATRTARAFSPTNMSATTTPRSRGRGVAMAAAAATTAGDGEAAGGGGGVAATAMDETSQTKPGRTGTGGSPSRSRPPLSSLAEHWDYSWIDQLTPETDPKHPSENKKMRPVFGGHYVLVEPTPLKNPRLVAYSPDVAFDLLGLTESDVESEEFARFFSGDVGVLAGGNGDDDDGGDGKEVEEVMTWATPYALSIMGTRYTSNCPYGTGDGYGDGRAISVGEVLLPPSGTCDEGEDATMTEGEAGAGDGGGAAARPRRLEMQLKGAGRTPFCRGADGRAVLRSSIREFLASEAMHYLGVSTTRALSLVVSDGPGGDVSRRQWYSDQQQQMDGFNPGQQPRRPPGLPTVDDPRLAAYPLEKRKQIIAQLAKQKRDPDVMIEEPNAIACRVAPSFVRVGHVDLFARRVATKSLDEETGKYDRSSQEWRELAEMLWHAAYREFREEAYEPYFADDDLHGCVTAMLRLSADKIALMVADWIRVGFCQGNFNADNCLVGGRTMDYGPFGFMDGYDPLFAKWTGSGEHFGFLNQPTAGYVNYAVLVESAFQALRTVPPVEEGGDADADADVRREEEEILEYAQGVFQRRVKGVFRRKLGFDPDDDATSSDAGLLWQRLEPMLREGKADWTVFWRQLTNVAAAYPIAEGSTDHAAMVDMLCGRGVEDPTSPFYEAVSERTREKLLEWMKEWRESLSSSAAAAQNSDSASAAPVTQPEERMRLANPKYILREWMLVDAYTKAAGGDENMIHELLDLIRHPYDEGRDDQHKRYYRRAPDESLTAGGTAYMT